MEPQRLIGIILACFGIALLIILALVKVDVDRQGAFLCEAVAENPNMTMDECPAHHSDSSWLLSLGFGLSFLVVGAGVFFLNSERMVGETRSAPPKRAPKGLAADEQALFALLTEGSAYQSDLVKATGFSKVKVTRILDRLEQKGLVERKRRGMTNLVVVKN